MRYTLPIRILIAVGLSLGLALLLLVLLYATDVAFSVWERLRQAPVWFVAGYVALLALVAAAGGWLVWRVLGLSRRRPRIRARAGEATSEAGLEARIARATETGIDVEAARRELADLAARREAGEIHVALLGQVSTGKSSLVRALLPEASAAVSPVAGTTREVTRYTWTSPAGDRLTLADLPGLNEADGHLDPLAREEAQRAHVVVYLVEGDLARDQYQALQEVLALGKPTVLALNKTDLLSARDVETLRERLRGRVEGAERVEVVTVSAGGERELVRVQPDGRQDLVRRLFPPRVQELATAVQRRIDADREALDGLRDAAVFALARGKLDQALEEHRRTRSGEIVASYTRKAVLGALAAVSPGSDLVIQGFLAVQLVRSLTDLYEVPLGHLDIDRFIARAGKRVGKATPLILAVVGNALKAFPGIGTLTGGMVHAVAYGLLFDSLGRAVADTLAARGDLPEQVALRSFEEKLGEDVEARARRLARVASAELVRRAGSARS
jgi:hypothetical protein